MMLRPQKVARSTPRILMSFVLPALLATCNDLSTSTPATEVSRLSVAWTMTSVGLGAFFDYTCGLTVEGKAYCWGSNSQYQLGVDSAYAVREPVAVAGSLTFRSIAAGWVHTCALTTANIAYCWGASSVEEHNSHSGLRMPTAVAGGMTFKSIAAANFNTCALTTAGAAYCWSGKNAVPAPVPGGFTFKSLSMGTNYACGVTQDDMAYCWGRTLDGAASHSDPTPVAGGFRFATVSAGDYHACGIVSGGAVHCWGSISTYDGPSSFMGGPLPKPLPTELRFRAVSAASEHTCGLTFDGTASCWGSNMQGQLGDGSTRSGSNLPVAVAGARAYETISARGTHTCATTSTGEAWCWGSNAEGQLGIANQRQASVSDDYSRVPVRVVGPRSPR